MEKKYEHCSCEKATQEQWQNQQTYKASNNAGPLYSVDTPPPTVSGALHIGHIFSYTQTDIIARFKRMDGFSVWYPFGFDDNGLPTERFVEKKRSISAHTMSRSAFINLCLEETESVEEQFKTLWQRMGLSVDWDACYSTISPAVRKISQESFVRLFKKGFIYRAYEPALYCPTCHTSVAQAELDDAQKPSTFNTIVFTSNENKELLVATTRPELLPGCVALFYHPSDARYKHLAGTSAKVPLYNFEVPVYADEHVDPDKGTGLVMCCTFGDKQDIAWYKQYKFPYKQVIDLEGRWKAETGFLTGLKATQARATIIEKLQEHNLVREQKAITHSVNVHERCKQEIEYIALSQWFLNILDHKQAFLDLADKIEWNPAFMKSRYKNWVENIGWNWCLSRQRFFGIPFPVWHCSSCKEIIVADINSLPIDPQETACPQSCTQCGSTNLTPDTDVMDTWNTSSLTPYICYGLFNKDAQSVFDTQVTQEFLPMGMRPQAHDIIRTWAFYTIVKTWMHNEVIPWKTMVISGHVLSDSKEKLSKSKENAKTNPDVLLATYPADAIRYWTASGSLGQDIAFSEMQLTQGQRLITKLWNAFRFIHEHTSSYPLQNTPRNLGIINEWILHQAALTFASYKKYLDAHDFNLALDTVESFFWRDMCDNYLELIKDQLFKPEQYSETQVYATRWTLYYLGLRLTQLYAPYMPHIVETLYQSIYVAKSTVKSIHQTRYATVQTVYNYPQSAQTMSAILTLVAQVRKLKTEQKLSLKTPIQILTIGSQDDALLRSVELQEQLIKGITHATHVTYVKNTDASSLLKQESEQYIMVINL